MDVVTGAMSSLLPKLAELIHGEYNLQKSVRKDIRFLKAELESMELALQKVSEASIDQPCDSQVKHWAKEVRELSYDIEDKVDTFMVRVDAQPQETHNCFKGLIDMCLQLLTKAYIQHKIGMDIKDIKIHIKEVSERRHRYDVDTVADRYTGPTVKSLRLSALHKNATELVGIEKNSEHLAKMIMEGDAASKELKKVSIVGFGGLGKTSLANVVYEQLKGHFKCGAIVSVSANPLLEKIFKDVLHQLDGEKYSNINESKRDEYQLINELKQFLQDKKYFIVIDDIWHINVWETIKNALAQNEPGSRIIITTRSLDIANKVGGTYPLEPLSPSDSRQLFYQRSGFDEQAGPHSHLVEESEKILKKCAGVPLAITTIASILATKKEKDYWSIVCQSMGNGLEGNSNLMSMRRILSVSYYDLGSHLKTCLLYLSLFPEAYNIDAGDLICKWIGEGFVHKEQGKTMYEVGEGYVEELVNRNMIQAEYEGHGTKIVSCRIHDMVRDLICFLSNEEQFVTNLGGQEPTSLPNKIRRLSFLSQNEDAKKRGNTIFSHVRSLAVSNQVFGLMPALSTFTVLRVLDVSYCAEVKNQHCKDICNLFLLRYLSLRKTSITEIPKEIGKLQILQVLDISQNSIEKVPSSLFHLPQLLHLNVGRTGTRLPNGFENLKSLQGVEGFINIYSLSMLDDVGRLTELRALGIKFCEWDVSYEKPFIQCLSNLVNLKILNLEAHCSRLNFGSDNLSPVLPQHLHSIDMRSCIIDAVPRWMSSLYSLSSVNITLFTLEEEDIRVLGSIRSLSYLTLGVKESSKGRDERLVIRNNYPFRCLKTLILTFHGQNGMELIFEPGAMQNLTKLCLEFGLWSEIMYRFGDFNGLGLEHLSSLELIDITWWSGGRHQEVEAAEFALRKALANHPNKPTLKLHKKRGRLMEFMIRMARSFIDGPKMA